MTRSMTGFAREQLQESWGQCSWELRAVNHRYLDLHVRLPEELRALEPPVRERVAAQVGRGKLECTLRFQSNPGSDAPLDVDAKRLKSLAEACARVAEIMPAVGGIDPLRLLNWPGVLRERGPAVEQYGADLLELLDRALASLNDARENEGEKLAGFIRERIETLEAEEADIRAQLPPIRQRWRERLEARLRQFGAEAEPGRLEQEMAILANRMDVDEELDRLNTHLSALRSTLDRREPKGRRLDFLMQECNREANTIASKVQDGGVGDAVLEMKVAVEQIREQVQNIE